MARELRLGATLFLALTVTACASGYEKFYQAIPVPANSPVQPMNFAEEPRIAASSGNLAEDVRRMYEEGFTPVGTSNFVGPAENQAGAIAQAKKVGAAIVIVWSKYQSTTTGAVPITTTTPQTTYSSGTMSAYGTGGMATGNYSGTSTTYVPQTTMIPYSVDRYRQVAVYFKPLERKGLGINFGPLSDQQRQELGSNKGIVVTVVRKGSPAFMADVLPGDILTAVNDHPVFDAQSSSAALMAARGGTAALAIVRKGEQIKKAVAVPVGEW